MVAAQCFLVLSGNIGILGAKALQVEEADVWEKKKCRLPSQAQLSAFEWRGSTTSNDPERLLVAFSRQRKNMRPALLPKHERKQQWTVIGALARYIPRVLEASRKSEPSRWSSRAQTPKRRMQARERQRCSSHLIRHCCVALSPFHCGNTSCNPGSQSGFPDFVSGVGKSRGRLVCGEEQGRAGLCLFEQKGSVHGGRDAGKLARPAWPR